MINSQSIEDYTALEDAYHNILSHLRSQLLGQSGRRCGDPEDIMKEIVDYCQRKINDLQYLLQTPMMPPKTIAVYWKAYGPSCHCSVYYLFS